MKKIYQIPTTVAIKVQTTTIMAGSEQIGFGSEYRGGVVLSRRGRNDSWDEEEDY